MLSDQIKKISSEFLEEAKSSPRLLTDMAAMEGYLAESYGERILIELLQNADDALSRKVIVKMIGATVFVANDGRPFTEDDLIAICRSGASKKERGQHIGYRGVGFKSTTAMTNNILISSNGCVFSFSKSSCAEKLGLRLSEVPTVRIPFFIKDVDMPYRTKKIFTELHNAGYTTIFAFEQAKKSIMEEEIREFDSSSLLFLRNVETIQFQDYKPTLISVSRKNESNGLSVSIHENGIEENWVVYKGKGSGSFAFKRSITGEIIEADIKLSVFHCYLPTLEQSPFKLKINADFSTDPSRKHLMLDSNTKAKLQMLTDDLTCLALKSLKGNYDRKILGALINRSTYAPIANDLYIAFSEAIKERNIILNGGTAIPLKKYLVMDDYFTLNEKVFIRSNSKIISEKTVINNDSFVERFIEKYCTESMPLDLYIALLSEKTFIKMCPDDLVAKLYAFSIKAAKNAIYNSGKLDINLLMIKDANGRLIELKNCVNKNLSPQMIDNLKLYCSSEDWIWFANKEKLLLNPYEIMDHGKIEKKINLTPNAKVTRWRSAEQQCVDIETAMGNKAIYVGKKNLGYDVESKMPNGKMRYIEVKLIPSETSEFTMTNNEYTAAHQYGEDFYMCIVIQRNDGIKVTYVKDPLNNIQVEKRVRQWEWVCDSFSGEEYIFRYED